MSTNTQQPKRLQAGYAAGLIRFVVAGLCLVGLLVTADSSAAAQSTPPVTRATELAIERELLRTRDTAAELKTTALNYRRLSESGSISKQEYRSATFAYKLAELDVLAIEFPEKLQLVELTRAKVEYEFKSKEFDVVDRLFRNGSVSQLQRERARSARDVAKLKHESAENKRRTKLHEIKIAQTRLALAESEFRKAQRLLQSRSISQTTYDKVLTNLKTARQGVAVAKKSVGVNVTVVKPDQTEPDKQ